MDDYTPEQEARDLLERMGIEDAQEWSSGDLVELANLIDALAAAEARAVLREPTAEMCRAAQRLRTRDYDDSEEWYADAWRAMYDAAMHEDSQ